MITQYTLLETKKNRIRVLVADDNAVNLKLAVRLLEKFGVHADGVANGLEVIESLEMIPYDLILMDVQMPELDGIEATKRIRSGRTKVSDKNVPIIAMTARSMKGDEDQCIAAGMNDYIPKPVDAKVLFNKIEQQL